MSDETTAELIERLQRELAAAREGQAGAILVQDATLRDCKRLGEEIAVLRSELEAAREERDAAIAREVRANGAGAAHHERWEREVARALAAESSLASAEREIEALRGLLDEEVCGGCSDRSPDEEDHACRYGTGCEVCPSMVPCHHERTGSPGLNTPSEERVPEEREPSGTGSPTPSPGGKWKPE